MTFCVTRASSPCERQKEYRSAVRRLHTHLARAGSPCHRPAHQETAQLGPRISPTLSAVARAILLAGEGQPHLWPCHYESSAREVPARRGGLASCSAARAIRERDTEGSVLLVGQEINRPYHRPPLSKAYLRREVQRDCAVRDRAGLVPATITSSCAPAGASRTWTCRAAPRRSTAAKRCRSTGCCWRPDRRRHTSNAPAPNLPNLFTVRTVEDVGQLHNAIDKATREGHRHDRGRGRVT